MNAATSTTPIPFETFPRLRRVVMRDRSYSYFFAGLMLCLLFAICSVAQNITADIRGTVHDPSGAVVPNATVTITDMDRNTTRTITTGPNGSYNATSLPV